MTEEQIKKLIEEEVAKHLANRPVNPQIWPPQCPYPHYPQQPNFPPYNPVYPWGPTIWC